MVPLFGDGLNSKQAAHLPKSPLKLYDMNGDEVEFLFQSDSIFSNPENKDPDQIFYNEIRDFKLTTISGYGENYLQMTLDTKFGFRTYFFVPLIYRDIISSILRQMR